MLPLPGADHRVRPTGTGGAARQSLRLLGVALAAALLLGATPLRQWTETFDDGRVRRAATAWEALTARAGLDRPYAALRARLRQVEAP